MPQCQQLQATNEGKLIKNMLYSLQHSATKQKCLFECELVIHSTHIRTRISWISAVFHETKRTKGLRMQC